MKAILFAVLSLVIMTGCSYSRSNQQEPGPLESVSPELALERLKIGNARYLAGTTHWEGLSAVEVSAHTAGQNPYAVILSCADSRVPVEHVFDAGVGEVFVLRVAGNVASSEVVGSAEYAVAALNTPLWVVMGHSSCGAVGGALSLSEGQASFPDHLQRMLMDIQSDLRAKGAANADIDTAVRANVEAQLEEIRANPLVAEKIAGGNLMVVGAVYDLESGAVEFM